MRKTWVALMVASGIVGIAAVPAAAQTGEGAEGATEGQAAVNPDEAAAAFEVGMRLFQNRNWAGALAAFQRAYDAAPHYAVLFNIGYCLKELQRYPEALDALQRYLNEGGTQIRTERRIEAEATIAELQMFISTVTIRVNVDGATIEIDGDERGTSPIAEPILLGAGRHIFSARLSGYREAREALDIAGGEERDVELVLEAEGGAVGPVEPEGPEMWYEDWLGWTLAGVGVACVGAGGYFLSDAADKQDKADSTTDINAQRDLQDDANISWGVGGALVGVGAGALATGIVLLVLYDEPVEDPAMTTEPPAEESATGVAVMPLIGPFGFGLSGTF